MSHAHTPSPWYDELEASTPQRRPAGLGGLPRLLRWIGASVLMVAAFSFMLQSWQQHDDPTRYLHFLGFTALLTFAGFFCGLRIGDEKGARTFLALAVAAVPVHFTVLGALLYSQLAWLSRIAPSYPAYALFRAPDAGAALATLALGIAVLIPVCWISFLAFARPAARPLVVAYLLANATLLIPTRHPDAIGGTAFVLLAAVVTFDRVRLRGITALATAEGRFARALLTIPFAVLIGRTLHLYDPSALFWAATSASAAVAMFVVAPPALYRDRAVLAQHLALVPAATAWLCIAWSLLPDTADAWTLPLTTLPIALLLTAMSLRMIAGGAAVRSVAALLATGSMTGQLLLFPGLVSSLACIATAIVVASYGLAAEQRSVFLLGLCALAVALLYQLRYATHLYALSPWGALAALGVVTVLAASLLERHHPALTHKIEELRQRMASWEA